MIFTAVKIDMDTGSCHQIASHQYFLTAVLPGTQKYPSWSTFVCTFAH